MRLLVALVFALAALPVIASKSLQITAHSWLIADGNGRMIEGANIDTVRSIASITKLMTSIVVLDSGASLTESLPRKWNGKTVNRQELINLAMIRSDNPAAQLLCDTFPGGFHRCIIEMNRKATSLGMNNTLFTDPTGRLNTNVSTATDLVKLVVAAMQYSQIVSASNTASMPLQTGKRQTWINNTNSLVGRGWEFVVSKTGFIRDAGGCIVMAFNTSNGIKTVILLGSRSIQSRIPEAQYLATRY